MGIIHILDENLINKIAAGEVVERPASIVKELIENSLDASATEISVEVAEGGISYIKVSDNGAGMDEEDARLCLERHATSKIKSTDDLFSINTLGFRGEALASIVAVSHVKLTTKKKESKEGILIEASAGKILRIQKAGCPNGTTIEIEELFFNTPVRKKFLKPIPTEFNHILDIVTRYALSYHSVFFRLTHNGSVALSSPKSADIFSTIVNIYGKEIGKNLIKVEYSSEFARLSGYLGKPAIARQDKSQQSIFINHRYITNKIISDALYDAFHSMLFIDKHPIAILLFEIAPSRIDVNVHPTKDIIRVKQEKELYEFVHAAVKDALYKNSLIPEVSIQESTSKPSKQYKLTSDKQDVLVARDKPTEPKIPEAILKKAGIGPILIIGQVNKTYILGENSQGLVIIDQHAAQERVFYEEFMASFSNKAIVTQRLLNPAIVELSPQEAIVVNENIDFLGKLGFETEGYGHNSFIVRSIPFIFERNTAVITDVIHELSSISSKILDAQKEERIIRFACKHAIKAGDELTKPEMAELLQRLDSCKQPFSCPHGRPTIVSISISELEKKFKRVA
jgi:DNA mismatch repair protein MutL